MQVTAENTTSAPREQPVNVSATARAQSDSDVLVRLLSGQARELDSSVSSLDISVHSSESSSSAKHLPIMEWLGVEDAELDRQTPAIGSTAAKSLNDELLVAERSGTNEAHYVFLGALRAWFAGSSGESIQPPSQSRLPDESSWMSAANISGTLAAVWAALFDENSFGEQWFRKSRTSSAKQDPRKFVAKTAEKNADSALPSDPVKAPNTGAAALTERLYALIEEGAVRRARQLLDNQADLIKHDERLARLSMLLEPSQVSVGEKGQPIGTRDNQAWLRERGERYRGEWVALREGNLVDHDKSRISLHRRLKAAGLLDEVVFNHVPS